MNGKLNLFIRYFGCFLVGFFCLVSASQASGNKYSRSGVFYIYSELIPASIAICSSVSGRTNCAYMGVNTCEQFQLNSPNTGTTCYVNISSVQGTTPTSQQVAFSVVPKISCSAASGLVYDPITNTCISPPPPSPTPSPPPKDCTPKKGLLLNAAANDQGQICVDQCRASPVKIVQQCNAGQTLCLGTWAGQYRYDGSRCNGSEISVPATDMTEDPEQLDEGLKEKLTPYECFKKGLSSGTVNGKTICIPNNGQGDTTSKESSTETKTNPDGSTTTTTTTTTKTDSGGKVTTETQTTTETKDKNGVSTGTASGVEKTEVDKETHCKKNPNDDVCKAGTASGGCDKAFTCEGDAIACEATKVGWLNYCSNEKHREKEAADLLEMETSNLVVDGNKILSGEAASGIRSSLGLDGENTIDLSKAIKQDGFLSCGNLTDQSFNVFGKSITIPFSKMNYWLGIMGKIAVMFTLVVAAKIIVGGRR